MYGNLYNHYDIWFGAALCKKLNINWSVKFPFSTIFIKIGQLNIYVVNILLVTTVTTKCNTKELTLMKEATPIVYLAQCHFRQSATESATMRLVEFARCQQHLFSCRS